MSNKALQLTKRGGGIWPGWSTVINVRFAAERQCWANASGPVRVPLARGQLRLLIAHALLTVCCGVRAEPLPQVRTPLAQDLGCGPYAQGRVAAPASVIDPEFLNGCVSRLPRTTPGAIRYSMTIDRMGMIHNIRLHDGRYPLLADCLRASLLQAPVTPALDCTGTPLPSTFEGEVSWTPWSASISAPGVRFVISGGPQ